ncbi:MAG: 1-deoxy-D-xylulose-5-phosphate reductoisomerase [Clostridia bacterium]|nr:1-deoxy-D-xylulose-5-phosphate reductoisomerase [Clostridia bacterium]
MKKVSVLGSTGSVGTQTLDIIRRDSESFSVSALAAGSNVALLEEQAREFNPQIVAVASETAAKDLKVRLADTNIKVLSGEDGLCAAASVEDADITVGAIVGIAGLKPVLAAIESGKDIALANKETLVTAGDIVMARAKEKNVKILPVDSEHSAIFQCLDGRNTLKRIYLTASGGPFFGKKKEELENVTAKDALKHPTWSMGAKITIDSASLANKGLEVIEATHLFGVPADKIEVVVHRQSIVHSMVEFVDGAVIAQLGSADMRTPISVALNYPERSEISGSELDIFAKGNLTFEKPDTDTFRMLALAFKSSELGGTMPTILNGANEEAVSAFLMEKCRFLDIADMVEGAMENHKIKENPTLADIFDADREAREFVKTKFNL